METRPINDIAGKDIVGVGVVNGVTREERAA